MSISGKKAEQHLISWEKMDIEKMDNSRTSEETNECDVTKIVHHKSFKRNNYGSLRKVAQNECSDDYTAHLHLRHKRQSKLNNNTLTNQEISMPCYYILRLIGLWQPTNACGFFKFYHCAAWVLWLAAIIATIMLSYRGNKFHWKMFLNSVSGCIILLSPFCFLRYYFCYGHYNQLALSMAGIRRTAGDKVKQLSRIYTCISVLLWILGGLFLYFHWIPLFRRFKWPLVSYILYGFAVILTAGWWACWNGFSGFVCHLHKFQINRYCRELDFMYGYSDLSTSIETINVAILLDKFHDIRFSLTQANKDLRFIISFAMIFHVLYLFIFTLTYWSHDFGDDYFIWHYVGRIAFNILSILLKLYPAATVGQALHDVVIHAGEHCYSNNKICHLPKERFILYRYVFLREENLGLHVLGVKITSKVAVGFVMTFITAGLTFLRYAITFIEHLEI